eukprot:CAMPEP_0168329274 /NCGR_PEP_ID=MMETSP0213-20121227/7009_1 /TAXON_ID=151035 /ORGANISM="Euplotes harpa, Strain FSP1.4" /LENGTH=128 /DNA_ID=CAMNT_0008332565 /DNA_START=304 /DNA_END=687 /DNA_ORIENTATION=-
MAFHRAGSFFPVVLQDESLESLQLASAWIRVDRENLPLGLARVLHSVHDLELSPVHLGDATSDHLVDWLFGLLTFLFLEDRLAVDVWEVRVVALCVFRVRHTSRSDIGSAKALQWKNAVLIDDAVARS